MDHTLRNNNYPLLGEPEQMFEGDNLFVIVESAEKDKVYSFICPRCHSYFISSTHDDEVRKIKCPECDTYICFSTKGEKPSSKKRRTQVTVNDNNHPVSPGLLVWTVGEELKTYTLPTGSTVIGRNDEDEPSDISVNDATASRRSVRIDVTQGEQTGKRMFRLSVQRTTNPVYVNHNALYTNDSIYLNPGDTIKVGATSFILTSS